MGWGEREREDEDIAAVAISVEVVVVDGEYSWVEGSLCIPSLF